MTIVTIVVKILSGELLFLDIPNILTGRQLDDQVYEALPEEIRPRERYQMALLRLRKKNDEDQYEEIIPDDMKLVIEEGEYFCISLMTDEFNLELDIGMMVRARNPLSNKNDMFECRTVYIYKNSVLIHKESLYFSCNNTVQEILPLRYDDEKVKKVMGQNNEMTIHIEDDAKVYETIRAFAKKVAFGCPNMESVKGIVPELSCRLKYYLEIEFLRNWVDRWGDDDDDDELF